MSARHTIDRGRGKISRAPAVRMLPQFSDDSTWASTRSLTCMLLTFSLWPAMSLGVLSIRATVGAAAEPELSSQAIADKIEDELVLDPGVVATRVDVNVTDGIAQLTGRVNSLLAKERSTKIASTVKGVRSVVNRIRVRPSEYRVDRDVARDINEALVGDPATDSYEVMVDVKDGVATVAGTVQSYSERDLVLNVVKGVTGVVDVKDSMDVEYSTQRPDPEIEREIEQLLKWNIHVDDNLIQVDVDDGDVVLSGTVGSAAEKILAESVAGVAGVESVESDRLSVERWARDEDLRGGKYALKTSEEIREAVLHALMLDPRVMSFNVDVDATGSLITLRGTVDNLKAKRAAEQDARSTVGVSQVANRLKVRVEEPPTDEDVEAAIRAALLRDPYVQRFDITSDVVDGTARLYGVVDSHFEKNRVDDIASRVMGVVEVSNHLTVSYDGAYLRDPYVDDGFVSDDMRPYERRHPNMSDTRVLESIESELWWSPFVDSDEVVVTVDDGIARLTGAVDTWSERRAATDNAYHGGATLVDNDLALKSDSDT